MVHPPRLETPRDEELTPEQLMLKEVLTSSRPGLVGPFAILIRRPDLAEPANLLHNAFRLQGHLDRRLFELVVLMVAREWSAPYAWQVHEAAAVKAGLAQPVIDAIRERRVPDFSDEDERLYYDITAEFQKTKTLSDRTYARAHKALGTELLIELVTAIGFYGTIMGVLNTFHYPAPNPVPVDDFLS